MEHTRESVIASLRVCARHGVPCSGCIYETVSTSIACRDQLMYDAAAMLEEIGKGELPQKPEKGKADPAIEKLRLEHETLRGRADVLSHATGAELGPFCFESPLTEQNVKELIAYYEGFCDAAITVLEMRSKEK